MNDYGQPGAFRPWREATAAGALLPIGGDGMVVEADETYYGELPPEKAPIRKNPDRPKFGPQHTAKLRRLWLHF